ncbi:MAG: thioredoxin-disulfide reductase [Lachnospiraceae bacterium]|nr:thioredoxin-disulfide reductase [Lachnospiraceae bacterium]
MYDVIIIGSGPAGLTAAIYAERAKLSALVIEKEYISGGQVVNTYEVDNYPGLPGIGGVELGMKFREHAEKMGAVFATETVEHITIEDTVKKVVTDQQTYEARSLIIATGAVHRKLEVPGEEELAGMGVSYCATCDGAFFKGRTVAVIGGGDVAVEDAIFLARICEKVYLIHRRDSLRAAKMLQEKLFSCENVELVWDAAVEEICGEDQVESIRIKKLKNGEKAYLPVDGVFIAVGIVPNTKEFCNNLEMNEGGYLVAGEDCAMKTPGIYAAGDVRTKKLRQIITAAADGAVAAAGVEEHLNSL